jgi:hypothetical protein
MKEKVRNHKRNQLIRSWQSVLKEYPPALGMEKELAADWLLSLEDAGKLNISFELVGELIEAWIRRVS